MWGTHVPSYCLFVNFLFHAYQVLFSLCMLKISCFVFIHLGSLCLWGELNLLSLYDPLCP